MSVWFGSYVPCCQAMLHNLYLGSTFLAHFQLRHIPVVVAGHLQKKHQPFRLLQGVGFGTNKEFLGDNVKQRGAYCSQLALDMLP